MKKTLRAAAAALVTFVLTAPALASTDCTSTVKSMTIETGSKQAGIVVSLETGVSFALSKTSANAGPIMGMAMMANNMGRDLTARFAADGVDCKQSHRRTDLVAIVLGPDTTMTTTTPSAITAPPTTTSVPQPPVQQTK